MSSLVSEKAVVRIKTIVCESDKLSVEEFSSQIKEIIYAVYDEIPEKKRISYGRYSVVLRVGTIFYKLYKHDFANLYRYFSDLFYLSNIDEYVKVFALQMLSLSVSCIEELNKVMKIFIDAAKTEEWQLRESAVGVIRKLIKKFPAEMHNYYMEMSVSENDNIRRFVSESLRPVVENKFFHDNPEYAFAILRNMYEENAEYPRVSVGNNLSDWMRINSEVTLPELRCLINRNNENSHKIAYRACRNYIKKSPLDVFELLNIDFYKYKDKKYWKKDYV